MKLHAETWDKMQDIMARYNDHMLHISVSFEGTLNENIVKKAAAVVIDKIPVLKSRYYSGLIRAEWRVEGFDINKLFSFTIVESGKEEVAERFLLGVINSRTEPQIKINLVRCLGKDTLNFLINHQAFDGADAKVFLNFFASVYSDLISGGDGNLPIKDGTRSDRQIYDGFSPEDIKRIGKLVSYSKKQKHKIAFPFERRGKVYPRIHKLKIGEELFCAIKNKAKRMEVSLNDVILAAYYRVCLGMIRLENGETLGIPNMVNLRRYIKTGESAGFTNLTSMIVCNLGQDAGIDIDETVLKCKKAMDLLKEDYPGLHGLSLLDGVFKYAPHSLAKFLIGNFFKNPLIGISNIGIIKESELNFGGVEISDAFMTGSVKYPPYMQLALTTFKNRLTFTIANYGTDKDHDMLKLLLGKLEKELKAFVGK